MAWQWDSLGIYLREIKNYTSTQKNFIHLFSCSQTLSLLESITKISLSRWIFKQSVVHPYYDILLGNKKERNTDIPNNLDGSQGHSAEGKNNLKRWQIWDYVCITFQNDKTVDMANSSVYGCWRGARGWI